MSEKEKGQPPREQKKERRPGEERPVPEATEPKEAAEPKETDPAEERDRLLERLMRLQAEFENFRKRMIREQAEWEARAKEHLVLDLLPALDSFDRALKAASDSPDADSLRNGMMLVHKQLLDALRGHGVEPIEALGQPFDPNLHEAFLTRAAEENETPGTIVEEFATGYRLKDRVIRPTKGVVAADPAPEAPESPEEE